MKKSFSEQLIYPLDKICPMVYYIKEATLYVLLIKF